MIVKHSASNHRVHYVHKYVPVRTTKAALRPRWVLHLQCTVPKLLHRSWWYPKLVIRLVSSRTNFHRRIWRPVQNVGYQLPGQVLLVEEWCVWMLVRHQCKALHRSTAARSPQCESNLGQLRSYRKGTTAYCHYEGKHIMYRTSAWSPRLHLSGPRLNIKTVLSTYGDFHVKDKTAVRTSYL